jgi:MarR family transcriptional repressor of emrRAB
MPDLPRSCVLLSRLLQHLGRGMSAMLEHEIRPFGLNEAEFRVLTTLFSQPDGVAHPTDLCSKTSQSPANMSRISDALVSRDLITRLSSLRDRRKMVLFVPLRDIFKDFSDEDQQRLVAQLKHLSAKLELALSHHVPEPAE